MLEELLRKCIEACQACLDCDTISDQCRAACLVCVTACKEALKNTSAGACMIAYSECSEAGYLCRECNCETHKAAAVACVAAAEACRQSMYRSADGGLLYRFVEAPDQSETDEKTRTIAVAFSSETPVFRIGNDRDTLVRSGEEFYEVLDHSADNADLSLLNDSGPFLDEHKAERQLGKIVRAEIDKDRVGRAQLAYDDTDLAKDRYKQMRSKSRPHISMGYRWTRVVSRSKAADGLPIVRFAWEGEEISSVAMPADRKVGVGRGKIPNSNNQHPENNQAPSSSAVDLIQRSSAEHIFEKLSDEQKRSMKRFFGPQVSLDPDRGNNPAGGGTAIDEGKIRSDAAAKAKADLKARKAELRKRGDEIIKDFPQAADKVRTMVDEAVETDETIDSVSFNMLRAAGAIKPAKQVRMADLGMDEQEQKSYSILRGIQSCLKRDSKIPDGLEGEVHEEMAKRNIGVDFDGFAVPSDAPVRTRLVGNRRQRDLSVGVFAQGGASVATQLVTPIIEILRNRMVSDRLGVRSLSGLEGNVLIPRQTGAATAYSVTETGALTISTQALDQIALSPKRVGAFNKYSRQLLLQSSLDVENFIRDDLLKVIAIDWDRIILNGLGNANEPLGIMQTPGIGSVVFGAAATYAKVVAFETAVAAANADVGEMAYVTSPTAKGVLKSAAKLLVGATTVAANPIWDGRMGDASADGEMNGYRAAATNQIPNNLLLFGVFSEAIHALWGGYDVVVNPFSDDVNALVRIVINTFGDVAIRHPQAFCLSADSAAQ